MGSVGSLDRIGSWRPRYLETKLFSPRPPRSVVARPRLTERLDRVADSKLALVWLILNGFWPSAMAELASGLSGENEGAAVVADAYPSPRMREKTVQSTGTPS